MAIARITCKCIRCKREFEFKKTCKNARDARSYEQWAAERDDYLCGKCQNEDEQKKLPEGLYATAKVITRIEHDGEVKNPYLVIFKGDTYSNKEKIKELGATWNKDKGYWYIKCNDDTLHGVIELLESNDITILNEITEKAITEYKKCEESYKKARKEYSERIMYHKGEYQEELEQLGDIPAFPEFVTSALSEDELSSVKWNRKFYGKEGSWSIYLNGTHIMLSDAQKEEFETVIEKREQWKKDIELRDLLRVCARVIKEF